jgi:hypothetical protein
MTRSGLPHQDWGRLRSHQWILVVLCAATGLVSLGAGVAIAYRIRTIELTLVPDGAATWDHVERLPGADAALIDAAISVAARSESWSPQTLGLVAAQTRSAIHPSVRAAWEQTFAQRAIEVQRIPAAQMAEPLGGIILKRTGASPASATVAVAYLLHQFLVVRDPPGWTYVRTQVWVMTVEVVAVAPDDDCPTGLLALLPQRQMEDDFLHDGGRRFWSAAP